MNFYHYMSAVCFACGAFVLGATVFSDKVPIVAAAFIVCAVFAIGHKLFNDASNDSYGNSGR